MQEFNEISVFAPAKVNLHLAVLDKREDGFHDLESVFLAVDFGDTLYFQPGEDNKTKIVIEGSAKHPSIPDNIILRAVSLFREKTGFSQGLKIRVEKRIPIGGGLGGGSSNAAATLLALNKIAGSPLNRQTLLEMAAVLGSDVPFFIYETPAAWVFGRGERIQPIEAPCQFLVLVNPGFSSDTVRAFKLLDEYRVQRNFLKDSDAFLLLRNDFLPVFKEKERAVYNEIISRLHLLGAELASLSGAGSTCFGVFKTLEQAQNAANVLSGKWEFVQVCYSHCER